MDAFRRKAGIKNRAIQQRSKAIRSLVTMPGHIATYVAAHRAGVPLEKYLDDSDLLRQVAEYDQLVYAKEQAAGAAVVAAPSKDTPRKAEAKTATEVRFPNFKVPPGTLSGAQVKNAQKMATEVYPLLYAFENSVREFVHGHLTAAYGKDWWDRAHLVKSEIRKKVEIVRRAEGADRWVERKTAHPIYYIMLGDLATIMLSNDGWKVFKPIFNRQGWVEDRVASVEVPRNVVAHMNPLLAKNIKGLEVRAQEWFDQIKDHLPAGS